MVRIRPPFRSCSSPGISCQKSRSASRWFVPGLIALALFPGPGPRAARGEEVSRQAPAGYEAVAKLLTPLDEVLHPRDAVPTDDNDGVILLDEEVQTVDAAGRRLIVEHRIERAVTEAGARRVAESVQSYRKGETTIHLLLAQTVPPEGGAPLPVRSDAALLRSPQDDAGDSLYDDLGELRLIFPNVKAGSVTESVVAIEEDRFRIPGEFAAEFLWAGAWPRQRVRRVVELPRELAARLHADSLGADVPAFRQEGLDDGQRVRFTWVRERAHGLTPEPHRAPTDQVGPVTRLSTLPDWRAFAHWYAPLLEQRSALSAALAAKVDDWTRVAASPRETLRILLARVAGDVRYTGLEFGLGALQPHDVCDVWDNQYGDCKDKANLLRAMLEHKGIPAHLILLETGDAGRIDRRSPGFGQFDHAIVAVDLPGEAAEIFCDPTIARATPGLLGPGDVDREVLVLKGEEPVWTRTPAQEAGTLRYDFDLKLADDGSLAGWFSLAASGYYGASYAERCAHTGKEQYRSLLADIVQEFYPTAEVVDTDKPDVGNDGTCRLRAYFVTPAQGASSGDGSKMAASRSLAFPSFKELLPEVGDRPRRETAFFQVTDHVEIAVRFAVPPGWGAENLPSPYHLDSEALRARAGWETGNNVCGGTLDVWTRQNTIPPEQFATFYNAVRSLRSWLGQPLLLAAQVPGADKGKPPEETVDLAAADFPMMPSGEGQLELVDKRFPAGGNPARRRAALERTRQYFPQDRPTLFRAGIKLALLDLAAGKAAPAAAQIRALLQNDAASLAAETATWGEYILGLALKAAGQPGEARDIFVRLARDPATPEARRAYAGWEGAALLKESDPAEAIRLLLETLPDKSDDQAEQYSLLAELLLRQDRGADLDQALRQFLASGSPQLDEVLAALGKTARDLLAGEHEKEGRELIRRLEEAARGSDAADRMGKALAEAKSQLDALAASRQIQQNLRGFLTQHPLPADDPSRPEDHPKAIRTELVREMDAKEQDGAPEVCLRDGLELLIDFPPDEDYSHLLWRTAAFADWRERGNPRPGDGALLDELFDLCERLPATDDNRYDGRFLRAKRLERLGDLAGALRVYESLRDDPQLPATFRNALALRLGKALEQKGDLHRALAAYHEAEGDAATSPNATDAQGRAALIHLGLGERAEAFRLFDLLAGIDPAQLDKATAARQIKAMIALTRDRARAAAYWDAAARWLPQWRDFLRENEPALLADDDNVVPAIADLNALGQEIGKASRDKDRARLLRSFRLVVHAARWDPGMTVEVDDIILHGQRYLLADFIKPARGLAIAIGEAYALDDSESSRKNQALLAANLLDAGQPADALAVAQKFRACDKDPDDWSARAVARLWAIAVNQTGGEAGPPTAALERQLASPTLGADERSLAVNILAQLYTRASRAEDEEKLLARELENPAIKADADESRQITARLAALRNDHSASIGFSQAVARWLDAHKPAWFDYASPKSLDDPLLSNPEAFVNEQPATLSPAEIIKGKLLIAGTAAQPLERKIVDWNTAVDRLLPLCQTRTETRALIESVVAENGFTDEVRSEAVWLGAMAAAEHWQAAEFEHWMHCPQAEKFNEYQRASTGAVRLMLDACNAQDAPAEIETASRQLLRKPVGYWETHALREMFFHCLRVGAFPAAERLAKGFATMEISPDFKQTRAAFQLEMLKNLREQQRLAPLLDELRRLTLAHVPAERILRPAILDEWSDPYRLEDLREEDAQQVRLWQIKTRSWDMPSFHFWTGFIRGLALTPPEQEFARSLKVAFLRLTSDDHDRSQAVPVVQDSTDTDDVGERQWLAETVRPYRDPTKWPQTYAVIRLGEIGAAVRAGQPVDLEAELKGVQAVPWAKHSGQMMCIEHYLQIRDPAKLANALDALSPDELLQHNWLWINIPALELAGRSDEAALAREAARTELDRAFVRSWSEGLGSEAVVAYRLVKQGAAANDGDPFPAHWLEGCLARIQNRRMSLGLRIKDARHRQDWPAQAALAAEAIGAFPTVYDFYYDQAEALYMTGRKEDARHPLEVYTRYSKNTQEYPQAMQWLDETRTVSSVP